MNYSMSNISQIIIETLNGIFSKLFSSIDTSLFSTLDDLLFIDIDILQNSYLEKLIGNSNSSRNYFNL